MKQMVYISSTYTDLKDFRLNLINFFNREGHENFEVCKIMERMYDDGSSKPLISECLEEVKKCDIFILILGNRIGSYPLNDREHTYIEREYDQAMECNKPIYRFILNSFDEKLCDDVEKFRRFAQLMRGFHHQLFSNLTEFENGYLKIFYKEKKFVVPDGIEIDLVSGIDRKFQVMAMNRKLNTCPEKKVQYYFYFSHSKDYSHMLNFRISNQILQSKILRFKQEYFVTLESVKQSSDETETTEIFVNEIAKNSFGMKGKSVFSIKELFNCLNDDEKLKCLVVPIRICHKIETDIKTLEKICSLLKKFSLPDNPEILNGKRIVFLLNIQLENNVQLGKGSDRLTNYFKENIDATGIGSLDMINGETICEWIRENFESNPGIAEEYLRRYFRIETDNSMWMTDIVPDAIKLVKEIYVNKT